MEDINKENVPRNIDDEQMSAENIDHRDLGLTNYIKMPGRKWSGNQRANLSASLKGTLKGRESTA